MPNEVLSFADIARKIGNRRLGDSLEALASNVETGVHNPVFVPLHSDVRDDVKRLKAETERFESALNQVSKWILDLPVRESECLPAARHILREVDALCDKALTTISAKGGAMKKPGRVTCAMIVIEAWAFAHGRAPGVNNKRVQEICDDYWRACGGQPIVDGDPSNWRRPLEDALADQDTLHRYIRDEIRLCAAEQPR
jgi:hypothetical protein